jgi:signal transduction histidine kinase
VNADQMTSLAASAGELALGLLVLRQRTRNPVAMPLVATCASLAGWSFCALAFALTGEPRWHVADVTLSPWSLPTTLHLVGAFCGRERETKTVLRSVYALAAAFSFASALGFGFAWAAAFDDSTLWSALFLSLQLPVAVTSVVWLVRHLREEISADEQARTRLVLGSLIAANLLGATELWDDFGLPVKPLGNLGVLASVMLLVLATVRHRLIDRRLRAVEVLATLLVATAVVTSYLGLLRVFQTQTALQLIGTITLTAVVGVLAAQVVAAGARQRRRLESLALQGRLSERLAHDLKNPLAALRGALQFLGQERAEGRSLDAHTAFLALMLDQVDRITQVVEDYRRLGRVEPACNSFDLHGLVGRVLALQPFAASSAIELRTDLAAQPSSCYGDPELVGLALENMLHNAVEAMPAGGALTVRTRRDAASGAPVMKLVVEDAGVGMDARQREHAFDETYTTKPEGSGLGLAFVKRVAEAQGGRVRLLSVLGRGTGVELTLPAEPPSKEAAS